MEWLWMDQFLVYVHCFNTFGHDETQLDILKRAKHSNNQCLGDIVPLSQLWVFAHLIPHFGDSADHGLTHTNSMELLNKFYLNKYFNKNLFFPLSLSH
ncbi:hypothetical protein JVU11DRAFT_7848 [Chiua virens]|nr:hypothetical protein JVU11DRAFT_7848 [Chiua virens]